MPLPLLLAHKLTKGLSDDRKAGKVNWLRPDSKSQVSVLYDGNEPKEVTAVVVSTQHTPEADQKKIAEYVREELGPRVLGHWWRNQVTLFVNPTGSFIHGGPSADAGVTGRKIIVDSYGGAGRHGGGAFSGKDPSKVDRSSAYFCRYVAKQVVASGLAKKAEIQVGYAIGMAKPVSVKVDTFGTGDERAAAEFVTNAFDFRPRAIIDRLDLLRPIYRSTTNYGHFGRPGLPWEVVEKSAAAVSALEQLVPAAGAHRHGALDLADLHRNLLRAVLGNPTDTSNDCVSFCSDSICRSLMSRAATDSHKLCVRRCAACSVSWLPAMAPAVRRDSSSTAGTADDRCAYFRRSSARFVGASGSRAAAMY